MTGLTNKKATIRWLFCCWDGARSVLRFTVPGKNRDPRPDGIFQPHLPLQNHAFRLISVSIVFGQLIISNHTFLLQAMPTFSTTGTRPHDCWLVDGAQEFGWMPAGVIHGIPNRSPIWLKVGTEAYGERHIAKRHGHWVQQQKLSVAELVFHKLGQSGLIYTTEREGKIKINLRLSPSALMVLDWVDHPVTAHFSVTTIFAHTRHLDGTILGRYCGRQSAKI